MTQHFKPLTSEPGLREYIVKFVGGTNAVTEVFGNGVTVTYSTTGIVILTWPQQPAEGPGTFIGATFGFQATTASGVKGYTCVPGAYNTSARTLTLNITNASETLANLAALQWLTCRIMFKEA